MEYRRFKDTIVAKVCLFRGFQAKSPTEVVIIKNRICEIKEKNICRLRKDTK